MRHRILATTALSLVLVVPVIGAAKNGGELAAAPVTMTFAERAAIFDAFASTRPANEPAAASREIVSEPAASAPAIATEPTATPEQAAPDPLASLDPADRAVAEKLRDLLATKLEKFIPSKKERAAVAEFYQSRNLMPLWLDKGVENVRATQAVARMKNADADGLEPGDYRAPNFTGLGPDALAEAELKLTNAVLTFARHLQAGRFAYTRVSRNMELPQIAPEPTDILNGIAAAPDAGKALDAYSPPHEAYRKLKATLAELRGKVAAKGQIETITANMERWRWYPRDLGKAHVIVNHPDFTLKVMNGGTQVWTTRVVIGKPSMPTPLLSETIKYITVNPTWHVPPSIVHNEYLPALAQDPTVLERMGLRVSYKGNDVEITQPPGDGNALGRIRFNFPNRFLVYQHDTPDKHMFAHDVRAYSHGCMRIQDPAKYAEVLLNIARPNERWTAERIKAMYGPSERDLQLPTPIWVHLTYQTAFVDNAGKLQFRRDVYGLDSRTIAAIKHERGTLEPASERKRSPEVSSGTGPSKAARPARTSVNLPPAPYSDAPRAVRPLALQPIYR